MRIAARLLVVLLTAGSALLSAQGGPARAALTPLVETGTVTAGSEVRVALQVELPEGYHMNSNAPRDPMLIPVVLSVPSPDQALPPGITVSEIVFPQPTDLKQRGADQPLSVFERQFAIGVVLKVAPDARPGEVTVPARLRYQACDETMCYIPTRAETGWTFAVGSARSAAAHQDVFGGIAFGRGQAPAAPASAAPAAPANASGTPAGAKGGDEIAALNGFVEQGTTFGYLGSADFLSFIRNAESGVRQKGLLDGRGPLAILLVVLLGGLALNLTPCVLPMIPINLAIIGAGAQAATIAPSKQCAERSRRTPTTDRAVGPWDSWFQGIVLTKSWILSGVCNLSNFACTALGRPRIAAGGGWSSQVTAGGSSGTMADRTVPPARRWRG